MLKKTNITGFMKDSKSSLIINTNDSELLHVKNAHKKNKELKSLQREVALLRQDFEQLKELVNGTSKPNTA